jgi:hypothetical protein
VLAGGDLLEESRVEAERPSVYSSCQTQKLRSRLVLRARAVTTTNTAREETAVVAVWPLKEICTEVRSGAVLGSLG